MHKEDTTNKNGITYTLGESATRFLLAAGVETAEGRGRDLGNEVLNKPDQITIQQENRCTNK